MSEREHSLFTKLERINVVNDESIEELLDAKGIDNLYGEYQFMFGAICLGVSALAKYYQDKPLGDWATWFYQELSYPYRMPEFGQEAITDFIQSEVVNV